MGRVAFPSRLYAGLLGEECLLIEGRGWVSKAGKEGERERERENEREREKSLLTINR